MKKVFLSLAAGLLSLATFAQTWSLDKAHSNVSFTITHMMISDVDGSFKSYDAKLTSSKVDFSDAVFEFSAEVGSINTSNDMRDGHLKGADFFDAAKYSAVTFKSTSIKKAKGQNYTISGNLTMHGVTKHVKLVAIGAVKAVKDPWGNIKTGFRVTGVVNRKDFGLTWNAALEAGGVVVSEEVTITCNIELTKI